MKNWKAFMLDKDYRTFRLRIFIALSILAGMVGGTIWSVYDDALFVSGIILGVGGIWLLYWCLCWILSAMPNDKE